MDDSIALGKEVRVKVSELLDGSPHENLYQAERAPGSHYSRPTVWRWLNQPETVFRISIYALYKFLRSLGYTHSEVDNLRLCDVFELREYEALFADSAEGDAVR